MNLDKIDPHFKQDLEASNAHVWEVARWLQSKGKPVAVNPVFVRPTVEARGDYADAGDLILLQRVEAKQRTFEFTGAFDFPYDRIIVDVAHSWDNAKQKPFMYVITNKSVTHCCIVLGSTSGQWARTTKRDHARGRDREYYECPLELCEFYSMRGLSS